VGKHSTRLVLLFCLAAPVLRAQSETITTPVAASTPEAPKIQATPAWYERPASASWFPRNWIRGYTDFEVAPSHNEPDLGRCAFPQPASSGGAASSCTAYARYMFSGYVELQPLNRTFAKHIFFFFEPKFSFGKNIPQVSYLSSMEPIAFERSVGVAVELPKHLNLRVTQHQVDYLGRYSNYLGPADLRTNGPYGLYTTVGVRWSFGGYGHNGSAPY
jgi:hypothetical protein